MSARPAVIITGAAKRVGAALALHFARNGYDIVLHHHTSKQDAQALAKEIEALGAGCQLFAHDMQDIKGIPALIQSIQKAMPHCAALINNASVFERATLMETDEALFDRQLDINFKAPFFLTQAFARTFAKGCVINMIDATIKQTLGSHFAYLLSKKALAEFTLMAARELGPHIRVNALCPGILLPSDDLDLPYMERLSKEVPLRKLGTPEQVSHAAYMLCEHEAITGQMIYIDGGEHLV